LSVVGSRLKKERENKGLTQMDAAKSLGISNGTLSGYERNYREPDFEAIKKIAKFYGVNADYLSGMSDVRREVYASASMHGEGSMNADITKEGSNVVYQIQRTEFILKELVNKYNIDLTVPGNKEKLEKIIELVDFLPSKDEQS
jgi:transcriptional regulator with XRE-family HTH domain